MAHSRRLAFTLWFHNVSIHFMECTHWDGFLLDFWLVLLIGFYDSACLMKQKGDVKIETGHIATDNGTRFGSVDMTVGHMCCWASLTVWISVPGSNWLSSLVATK